MKHRLIMLSLFAWLLCGQTSDTGSKKVDVPTLAAPAPVYQVTNVADDKPKSHDAYEWGLLWANWALVAAAFVTLGVVWRQTTATVTAAKAAQDTAVAMMNNGRAWVAVLPTHNAPELIPFFPGAPRYAENNFGFRIWNAGKTTATDVKAFSVYTILNSLDELPDIPVLGNFVDFPNRVLIPAEDEKSIHSFWTFKALEPVSFLTEDDVKDVTERRKFLYAYGIVKYENGAGGFGATSFGFLYFFPMDGDWRPKGFRPAGPPTYNIST